MTQPLIRLADYRNPADAQAVLSLLDDYARDPAGGGTPLSDYAKAHLIAALSARQGAFSVLAFADDGAAIGLVNCLEGFSTFACAPLVNIHDVVVLPDYRGQGIAVQMLACVEVEARRRGACKLTLEVLQGNYAARQSYARCGFAGYALDPAFGEAIFLQKRLAG